MSTPAEPLEPVGTDPDDHRLARLLAEEAGALLVARRAEMVAQGLSIQRRRDDGDAAAHRFLLDRLGELRPDDAVLSEEGDDRSGPRGRARLDADRVWIVDPLDGTREYGEVPRGDWAVHVALTRRGQPVAGAVALPARGTVLATEQPPPTPPIHDGPIRLAVSRSRPPAVAMALADALGAELVPMGSAGVKVSAVVLGEVDVYAHGGGQYEWDSCAPVAVARAAGLVATRLDGSELVYNRPDPYLPDLVVCHPASHERVRAVLDELWF